MNRLDDGVNDKYSFLDNYCSPKLKHRINDDAVMGSVLVNGGVCKDPTAAVRVKTKPDKLLKPSPKSWPK